MPEPFPYQNADLPVDERIEDLLGRMSLLEKCSQLRHESPAIERLRVPEYNWWNEALHGVARNGRATVFPQAMLGNYFGLSESIATVLEGLAGRLPEGMRLEYRKGSLLDRPRPNPANWTAFEDYSMRGRTYRFMKPGDVLFPFGFGLGYAKVRWSGAAVFGDRNGLEAGVTLENPGDRETSECVQVYLAAPGESAWRLVGFRRVNLPPGAHRPVTIPIAPQRLESVGPEGHSAFRPGTHRIAIAPHAPVPGFEDPRTSDFSIEVN